MGQKVILASLLAIGLVGCGEGRLAIKTEVQEKFVPTPYCPAPKVIQRPSLPFASMEELTFPRNPGETNKEYYGRLAQAYNASIVALEGYASELEKQIKEYADISKQSQTLKQLIEEEAKKQKSQ